jgi:hypothetical protein
MSSATRLKRCRIATRIAAVASVGWLAHAAAHHSPAAFDMRTDLAVDGTVVAFAWQNPHSLLTVETTGADGKKVVQDIEAAGASLLGPLGLRSDTIRPGEHVVVFARPSRRGPGHTVLGVRIAKDDGQTFALHYSGQPEPLRSSAAAATSLAGRWLGRQLEFFAYRDAVLESWPLTAAARASQQSARGTSRAQCVPYGPPALMMEGVLTTIELNESAVTLRTDLDGVPWERVVHLDLEEHVRDLEPSVLGHSIGRFEQGVLIIDTVGFAVHPEGFGFGVGSSERKHLVERLSLAAGGRELLYETTLEDPDTLTEPVSVTAHLDYRPDLVPSSSGCDLESARRYLNER